MSVKILVDVDILETLLDSHESYESSRRVLGHHLPGLMNAPVIVAAQTDELRASIARARERDAGR